MSENEEPKKIEIVSGDGKDLDISPVYDHLNVNRSQQKPKNIVIPKPLSEKKNNNEDDSSEKDDDKKSE